MRLASFTKSCLRMLKLSVKPSRREFWLSVKISVISVGAIGIVGFIVRLIASLLAVVG
ncbi:protein translocase SEC61 complex subunit gamma [Candidatus Bathyarchaeota archaeon]|nr:protein translocase SEC61 complex subunit gamma [Candidatus Bathyarchaeota archaeon]